MANTIKIRRSATQGAVPTTAQLALGELALNTYDGKLYAMNDAATTESVVELSGGAPGGSTTQIQYNNAGSFGGLSTLTTDGTDITLSGRFISSLNGAASEPPGSFTGTWFTTGGDATTTKPQLLIEPSGTTSTAWSTNGTGLGVNAASGFSGNLLDLQVDGTSYLNATATQFIGPAGSVFTGGSPGITLKGATNSGLGANAGNLGIWAQGTLALNFASNEIRFARDWVFSWSSDPNNNNVADTIFARDAADTLAQRRGTNAQTLRVYDTYSSATDYHRIAIATARATLSAVSGASVTATGLIPAGAVVMGVTSKVTTGLGTTNSTTGYKIGTVADDDRWGDITGTAAGTSSDNRDWTAGTIECFPAATDIIVTAVGGNFDGTGEIYLSVQYMAGQAD